MFDIPTVSGKKSVEREVDVCLGQEINPSLRDLPIARLSLIVFIHFFDSILQEREIMYEVSLISTPSIFLIGSLYG